MNGVALRADPRRIVGSLFDRQPALATYGAALLVAAVVFSIAQALDHRTIDDVSVWAKPTKFAFSIAVFACTNGWFFGYVRPDRRRAAPMRAVVIGTIVAGSFELAYITWQGAHGLASHFNRSSPGYEIMYGLMGVGALLLTGTTLPLAWEIARRPAPGIARHFAASVVIGLALCFVLGAGTGGYMAQGTGHSVGAVGGQLPLFGWNRSGGDLRIAHFLGIHAQQAIPLLGWLLGFAARWTRIPGLVVGTMAYGATALLLLAQAIAGLPLIPLPGPAHPAPEGYAACRPITTCVARSVATVSTTR